MSIWSIFIVGEGNSCTPRLERHLLLPHGAYDALLYVPSYNFVEISTIKSIFITVEYFKGGVRTVVYLSCIHRGGTTIRVHIQDDFALQPSILHNGEGPVKQFIQGSQVSFCPKCLLHDKNMLFGGTGCYFYDDIFIPYNHKKLPFSIKLCPFPPPGGILYHKIINNSQKIKSIKVSLRESLLEYSDILCLFVKVQWHCGFGS